MIFLIFLLFCTAISYFLIPILQQKRYLENVLDKYHILDNAFDNKHVKKGTINKTSTINFFLSLRDELVDTGDTIRQANTKIISFSIMHVIFICSATYFFKFPLIGYVVSILAAFLTSRINLLYLIKKRKISANIYSTDILAVLNLLLYTGFSMENSFSRVTNDIGRINKLAGVRFRQVNERISVVGLEAALLSFAELWDERMLQRTFIGLASFVKTGGSVTSFVSSEMDRISQEREAVIDVKVAKISSKMTVPMVVLIMFPSLGFMLAPAIAGAMAVFTHL